jgi:hypothetical protein
MSAARETAARPTRAPGVGRVRRAIVTLAILTVAATSVGPDLNPAADATRCHQWRRRDVPTEPVTLEELARAARSGATVRVSSLPGWADGVALPGVVVLAADADVVTWIHENIHRMQMRRDGTFTFWYRYTRDYLHGRWIGCGAHDAYLAIGYEIEARTLQRDLLAQHHTRRTDRR